MSIILFLIILSILVIVHELGHFSVAKYFGIRVDEFGLGYPPKAKKLFSWKGTDFTLNWLPFGGFVRIFGENPNDENEQDKEPYNFQNKNRGIQAAVLFAGVFCNFIFAWFLISAGLMSGLPAPAGIDLPVKDGQTTLTVVIPGSPAGEAGLRSGDVIESLERGGEVIPEEGIVTPDEASAFISASAEPVNFKIKRGEQKLEYLVTPALGLLPDRPAVGISMETVGVVELGPVASVLSGLKITWFLTVETAKALTSFLSQAILGRADLASVTGPVGLVSMVGEVKDLGLGYLISFTALISINLAIINLIPFPALDGGRLLFVAIESIIRRPIPANIFNLLNTLGFAALIFLMILITIRDVKNIF